MSDQEKTKDPGDEPEQAVTIPETDATAVKEGEGRDSAPAPEPEAERDAGIEPDEEVTGPAGLDRAFEMPRVRSMTPLTVVLLVLFVLCVTGLILVLNLHSVRDFFQGDAVFWVIQGGLILMLAVIVIAVIAREVSSVRYIERVLDGMVDVNKRMRLLMEAGRDIGSTLDLHEILEKILAYTSGVMGADIGAVFLREKSENVLRLAVTSGVDENKLMFKELPMHKGLLGEAAGRREMLAVDSTSSIDERDNVFFGAVEPASLVMVPLVARGKLLGMLVAGNLDEHAYTIEEKRLLDGLGELASMAITNAELYRIARKTLDALSRERGVAGSVLEEMVAGVITADARGRIGTFNREAQRLTGYTFAEKTQALLRPEVPLDQNPLGPLEHGMLEVLANPSTVREGDAIIMKTDMAILPISYRIYPLVDGTDVVGAACVFMEAKGADGESRKGTVDYQVLLRSLGARVERVYTHPLSRVIERLRGMNIDDWSRSREDLIHVLEAGQSTLLGLLEDLEQYLNCTTTREWDRATGHDIAEITADVVRQVLAQPALAGVRVSVKLSGLDRVFGFDRMIRTALEQVIENASIAARLGDNRVEVTGRDEGGNVRVEVRDWGPGLSRDSREYMFMPFFTDWEGRSGLGLSMVKRVMQRLGGRVGLSEVEGGAMFFLEFPTAPSAPVEIEEESATDAVGG